MLELVIYSINAFNLCDMVPLLLYIFVLTQMAAVPEELVYR